MAGIEATARTPRSAAKFGTTVDHEGTKNTKNTKN